MPGFSKKRFIVILAAFILVACGGGSGDSGDGDDNSADTAAFIETEFDIARIALPKDGAASLLNIFVRVLDINLEPLAESFTVTSSDACVTVSRDATSITVTPVSTDPCSEELTITAGDLSKKITVNVYDPLALDIGKGLLIKYVRDYELLWKQRSNSDPNAFAFWKPDVPDGYRALGSLARGNLFWEFDDVTDTFTFKRGAEGRTDWNDDLAVERNIPMIVVKDTSADQNLVTDAIDHELILEIEAFCFDPFGCANACRTDPDASCGIVRVYQPQCDSGYGAVGAVAVSAFCETEATCAPIEAPQGTCLKNEFLFEAGYDVHTAVSNPDVLQVLHGGNVVSGRTPDAVLQQNKIPMWPGTFVACRPDLGQCSNGATTINHLAIPMTVIEKVDQSQTTNPVLTASDMPQGWESSGPFLSSMIRVPFTLIPAEDPDCQRQSEDGCGAFGELAKNKIGSNVDVEPFHFLGRKVDWISVGVNDNRAGSTTRERNVTYTDTNIVAHQETFTKTTSTTVEQSSGFSFSYAPEYKGIKALNLTKTMSDESSLTDTFSYQTIDQNILSTETSVELSLDAPPGAFTQILMRQSAIFTRTEAEETSSTPSSRAVDKTNTRTLEYIPE